MKAAVRRWSLLLLAIVAAVVLFFLSRSAAGQGEYGFMPKGGRDLLLELLGPANAEELRKIATTRRTEAQWRTFVTARKKTLSEREVATLTAYLAVNMPLAETVVKQDNIAAALPRDGRQLAWDQCQFCHSLFSSHLTQDRDVQGWRNMFQSPFHRELKMTPQEREEFSRYSALNMPMKIDDVPQDLRF
ncbi:MAG TPA: hypothetical protein VFR86_14590 [Burkholderiaceae bacterium]|nr:hypothetical protein [Burkholderiaceae bacterium]